MFKQLCLLHGRDPGAVADPPLLDVLNGNGPLTWRDLQRVLREEVRDAAIAQFRQKGRLTAEQRELGREALAFLRAREPIFTNGIHDDIHHVVWSRGYRAETYIRPLPGLYRGHRDYRWRLETTLARSAPEGLRASAVGDRVRATAHFVEELRKRQAEFFARKPTDEELVAVAQHYGLPTGMLDFTRSLKVAAFFATSEAAKARDDDMGVIFELRAGVADAPARVVRESPAFGEFDLLKASSVNFGTLRTIEPALADRDNRIARQEGVFVTDFHPRDFQHVLGSPILFKQLPGEVFEDARANVTAGYLLGDDTPLARFAADVRKAFDADPSLHGRTRTLPAVHDVVLPDAGILGSNGGALQAVLTDGQAFVKRLRVFIDELDDSQHITSSLASVLGEYFALSRIRADVGQSAEDPIRPFAEAVAHLARLSGIEEARLWSFAKAQLPIELRPRLVGEPPPKSSPGDDAFERLTASVVIYLAAWERLQFVDGESARRTVEAAMGLLVTRRLQKILRRE